MWKRFLKRGETGQSIVILAFGFVALLAFVGIVTDISLMFVRYSQLKRAVDSAAIAAAGQMQKGTDLPSVELAARQFFVLQGMDPTQVRVETCQSSLPDIDPNTPGNQPDTALCTPDQRKLVRVTAQVTSPTVFLRLIGWRDVLLETAAMSETAVLDVVLMMDVSESMSFETTYADWASIGYGVVYIPPRVGTYSTGETIIDRKFPGGFGGAGPGQSPDLRGTAVLKLWQELVSGVGYPQISQEGVNRRLDYQPNVAGLNDPTAQAAYKVVRITNAYSGAQTDPRAACRVRFFPSAGQFDVPAYLQPIYDDVNWPPSITRWDGFVPTYDFYGCCNDPSFGGTVDLNTGIVTKGAAGNGSDANFSDLICQPFKKARDATRQFLQKIDFLRGDRVAFVTFGRTAFIIDPDGAGTRTAMIDNFGDAVNTLNQFVGVRADPNFYDWNEACGGWTGNNTNCADAVQQTTTVYASGFNQVAGDSQRIYYYDPAPTNLINDYPVANNCPFQNASQPYPFSRFVTSGAEKSPITRVMIPNPTDLSWAGNGVTLSYVTSYDYWASCRDGNLGAGLREANNALLDPTTSRRTGTVWVMVMLSDGASGASDPVRRNTLKIPAAKPYDLQNPVLPYNAVTNPYGTAGQYGAFGVCPYGRPAAGQRGELTELTTTTHTITQGSNESTKVIFPFCSDEDPESRHSYGCSFRPDLAEKSGDQSVTHDADYDTTKTVQQNIKLGNVYDVDILNFPVNGGTGPSPCEYYDVDDYARDWADYIGLQRDAGGAAQLPTIFTIGFGLNFDVGAVGTTPGPCDKNMDDCLGEELLRYIADVGDNNTLDTDYQQAWKTSTDGSLPTTLPAGKFFGQRGPCEDQTKLGSANGTSYGSIPAMLSRLGPKQDCGNYFNAPDQTRLTQVFNEIASRMFTRLAG